MPLTFDVWNCYSQAFEELNSSKAQKALQYSDFISVYRIPETFYKKSLKQKNFVWRPEL